MSYPIILACGWSDIAEEIDDEIREADARFGRRQPQSILIAALAEETGEVARALLHEKVENKPCKMSSYSEAKQLAAVAIRFMRDWKESPSGF